MTTLEERIAEAIHPVINDGSGASWLYAVDIARAVVAVLPESDVSDKAIVAALSVDLSAFPDFGAINRALVANVRALLDAQAAAHAAEVEALRAEVERWTDNTFECQRGRATAEADRDAYRARIDKVRADIELELEGSDGGYTDGLQSALNIIARYRTALDGT